MFKNSVNIHEVSEFRLRTLIYFGCGAIQKINDIADQLVARNIKNVLIVLLCILGPLLVAGLVNLIKTLVG